MSSVVCTLFEKDFHFGVAALVNSLQKHGFEGKIFIGYRGSLPAWASKGINDPEIDWPNNKVFGLHETIELIFLPVDTNYHLTNFKPSFLLLIKKLCRDVDAIFYFDPDIVIKASWQFFEEWCSNGVAVVHEIVSNDMPPNHPIRYKWAAILKNMNKCVKHELHSYINAGFCGLSSQNFDFLEYWHQIIEVGFKNYNVDLGKLSLNDKTHPFSFPDQDSLNMALMCYEKSISEVGPEGMDFVHGGYIMSHATGTPKPWNKPFLKNAILHGLPPTLAQKEYWKNAEGIVNLYSKPHLAAKKLSIAVSSFIGRFYIRK